MKYYYVFERNEIFQKKKKKNQQEINMIYLNKIIYLLIKKGKKKYVCSGEKL